MAINVQNTVEARSVAMVAQFNKLAFDVAAAASKFHAGITSTTSGGHPSPSTSPYIVSAANATNLATLVALCQNIYRVYSTHAADVGAHKVADATNTIASGLLADSADASACVTFANQAKVAINAHYSQSGVHVGNDGTNTVSASNATDQASAITLANDIKAKLNAHVQNGLTAQTIAIVG